ncbi:hypothetical protein DPX16_19503 [Anabarilius grahami]|uniref:Uncharacterized protein n=1 Tax=Anabarilius grahami TaxID=495550 RepID=A0A3N0Y769_ANAGA|nr:hypothetical protein DPX16_19503 [Anabarilius grahami]
MDSTRPLKVCCGIWHQDVSSRSFKSSAACAWNETALLTAYRQGLSPTIRAEMAIYDDTVGLENFISRFVRTAQCRSAVNTVLLHPPAATPAANPPWCWRVLLQRSFWDARGWKDISLSSPGPMETSHDRVRNVSRAALFTYPFKLTRHGTNHPSV